MSIHHLECARLWYDRIFQIGCVVGDCGGIAMEPLVQRKIAQFLRLPVRSGVVWQAGIFPNRTGPDDPQQQVWLSLVVDVQRNQIHSDADVHRSPIDLLVTGLLNLAGQLDTQGFRPSDLEIVDESLADELRVAVGECGTQVHFETHPEPWLGIRQMFEGRMAARSPKRGPGPLSVVLSNHPTLLVQDFAAAAAEFHHAAIWSHLSNFDLLEISVKGLASKFRWGMVMGAAREEFGIMFFASPEEFWDLQASRIGIRELSTMNFGYSEVDEIDSAEVAAWHEANLPLANELAFPLTFIMTPRGSRPIKSKELETITTILLALSRTTESEIDQGRWTKKGLKVHGKSRSVEISIPDLLQPPDKETIRARGIMPDPRLLEFQLAEALPSSDLTREMSLDKVRELVAERMSRLQEPPSQKKHTELRDLPPLEKARYLCQQALAALGRRRLQLARAAIALDPSHVEAHNIAAESTFDFEERTRLFRRAIELGAVEIKEHLSNPQHLGCFWNLMETRPYIRALYGWASTQSDWGNFEAALEGFLEILRLNHDDLFEIRAVVVELALESGKLNEAAKVLESAADDSAGWWYLRAFIEFVRHDERRNVAGHAIRAALQANSLVPEMAMESGMFSLPDWSGSGSRDEAMAIVNEQSTLWLHRPAFVDWMLEQREKVSVD